jgi:uncharacterized membrane protein
MMAATQTGPHRRLPDAAIGAAILVLLGLVLAAILRGGAAWADLAQPVQVHLVAIVATLGLTAAQLIRRKGTAIHRAMGWMWVVAMLTAALSSFWIRDIADGGFSFIHLLSAWVMIQVPLLVHAIRRGDVAHHQTRARSLAIFALLVAGAFTFPFGRLLGTWLFG